MVTTTTPGSSTATLKEALATCSLICLRTLYLDCGQLFKVAGQQQKHTLVTDADMEEDCHAARSKMEVHLVLLGAFMVEQVNKKYRKILLREMKSVGGMRVTLTEVAGKGVATTGFHKHSCILADSLKWAVKNYSYRTCTDR
jgi:hypothetical protein